MKSKVSNGEYALVMAHIVVANKITKNRSNLFKTSIDIMPKMLMNKNNTNFNKIKSVPRLTVNIFLFFFMINMDK